MFSLKLLNTSLAERWHRPAQNHLYNIVENNSDGDIEEEKSGNKVSISVFGNVSRRRKWLYAGSITLLWVLTAAILSLIIPAIPKLPQKPYSTDWFPDGELVFLVQNSEYMCC